MKLILRLGNKQRSKLSPQSIGYNRPFSTSSTTATVAATGLLLLSQPTPSSAFIHRRPSPSHRLLPFHYHTTTAPTTAFPPPKPGHFRTFVGSSTALFGGMSTHTTERDGSTITVAPKNEADQTGLVIICHGLGDTAEGFADVAEQMATTLPHVKFILPTAPTQRVTMNMGMTMPSWYDIVGLDERSNENCAGIDASQERILNILKNEHESTGLPYSRMILAGFSQGGALSLFTGLQLKEQLAGILVMSGYLPAASKLQLKQANTPIWHGHGSQDPLVQYSMAEKTKALLLEKGLKGDYTLKTYPIQHTVSPTEIGDALEFIVKVLPADDAFKVTLKDPKSMSVKELKTAIRKAGKSNKTVGFTEKADFVKLLQDIRDGKE